MPVLESAISLPTTKAPMRCEWKAVTGADFSQNPFSLASKFADWGGRMWACGVTYPPMEREHGEALIAALLQARGGTKPILFGDPLAADPMGTWLGTPTVRGDWDAGEETIVLEGLTPEQLTGGKAGDWISIDNVLYKLASDGLVDSSGYMNIDIYPAVRSGGLANGAEVTVTDAKGLFLLVDEPQWTQSGKRLYSIAFNLIEDVAA